MTIRKYIEYSSASDPDYLTRITEARFLELRTHAHEFDLFLWVDGPDALAGRRDVRHATQEGPFLRASTSRCPGRLPGDERLRPAAARAMLAVMRDDDWITPTEAFRAGNPEAAPPSAMNALVTLCKGRLWLDFERGHEVWESFDLQRKGPASPEPALRFRPGKAATERLGLPPVELRWCVAWSEPGEDPPTSIPPEDAPASRMKRGRNANLDEHREPVEFHAGCLHIILRDAVMDAAANEAILLVGLRDPEQEGPYTLHTSLVTDWGSDGILGVVNLESLAAGPQIDVPGGEVVRLRTKHQALPKGCWIDQGSMVIRLEGGRWNLSGDETDAEVAFTVRSESAPVARVLKTIRFRVRR